MAKRVAGIAALLFSLYFVVKQPEAAAAVTKGIGTVLITMAKGFGDFLVKLVA